VLWQTLVIVYPYKDLSWQHLLKAEIWPSQEVDFGCQSPNVLLFVNAPKFSMFFRQSRSGLMTTLSDFPYFDPFCRYSRSKSKIIRNRT